MSIRTKQTHPRYQTNSNPATYRLVYKYSQIRVRQPTKYVLSYIYGRNLRRYLWYSSKDKMVIIGSYRPTMMVDCLFFFVDKFFFSKKIFFPKIKWLLRLRTGHECCRQADAYASIQPCLKTRCCVSLPFPFSNSNRDRRRRIALCRGWGWLAYVPIRSITSGNNACCSACSVTMHPLDQNPIKLPLLYAPPTGIVGWNFLAVRRGRPIILACLGSQVFDRLRSAARHLYLSFWIHHACSSKDNQEAMIVPVLTGSWAVDLLGSSCRVRPWILLRRHAHAKLVVLICSCYYYPLVAIGNILLFYCCSHVWTMPKPFLPVRFASFLYLRAWLGVWFGAGWRVKPL